MTAPVAWPAAYVAPCGCTRFVVDALEETLDCPARWEYLPGIGWVHGPARRVR